MNSLLVLLVYALMIKDGVGKKFSDCLSYDLHKKENGIHIAKAINTGKVAHLPCHFCTKHKVHPMVWFRFKKTTEPDPYKPDKNIALWRAEEVELDTHAKENMNRVFLTGIDHTLVIKDVSPADSGTYFCAAYDKTNDDIAQFGFESESGDEVSAVQVALQFDFHSRKTKFTFLIHLDVIYVAAMRIVSRGLGYPVPADAKGPKWMNWMTVTTWGEWGECNICDMEGERRREGICVVRRIKKDAKSEPEYMDRVLGLFPSDQGVPCASTIFAHDIDIFSRPNEIEVGACKVPCNGSSEHKDGILGQFVYKVSQKKREMAKRLKLERLSKDVEKYEGVNLMILCPGSSPMSAVAWWKANTPLIGRSIAKITQDRITYTSMNALLFRPLREADSGLYYCKYGDVMAGHTKLIVRPNKLLEMKPYWMRLLYSFCGIFVIYAFILFVKYKGVLKVPTQKRTRSFIERQEQEQEQLTRRHLSTSATGSSLMSKYSSSSRSFSNQGGHNNRRRYRYRDRYDSESEETDSDDARTDWTRSSKATADFVQFSASRDVFLDCLEASPGHYYAYLTEPESSDHTESSGDELFSADLW